LRIGRKTYRHDVPWVPANSRRVIEDNTLELNVRLQSNIPVSKPYLLFQRAEIHSNRIELRKNNIFQKYGGWE
jgi:hypothetical protein